MTFLKDDEISSLVNNSRSIAPALSGCGATGKRDPIQACSLDLTVGAIYVPGVKPNKPGSLKKPRAELQLEPGRTALVKTKEHIRLPAHIGGIAFPPAGVSIKGLLMTNPGHVDPGYDGPLHLTVINMGREPFHLQEGLRIARLLLFELRADATAPFNVRRPRPSGGYQWVTEELMEGLTHDFMNITERAEKAVSTGILTAQIRSALLGPALVAILAASTTMLITNCSGKETQQKIEEMDKRLVQVDTKLSSLGGNLDLGSIEHRLETLEKKRK